MQNSFFVGNDSINNLRTPCKHLCEAFKNVPICSTFQLMDDPSFASTKAYNMEFSCIASVTSEAVLTGDTEDEMTAAFEDVNTIVHQVCPNQCSGYGNCFEGKCFCNFGKCINIRLQYVEIVTNWFKSS